MNSDNDLIEKYKSLKIELNKLELILQERKEELTMLDIYLTDCKKIYKKNNYDTGPDLQ
jgi:hypothetical protein